MEPEMQQSKLIIGRECSFAFSLKNFFIKQLEDSITEILDMHNRDLFGRTVYYLLDTIVLREQLAAVYDLFNLAVAHLNQEHSMEECVNLDFMIRTPQNVERRILLQFKSDASLQDSLALGRITDVSHFFNEGPPRLFIMDAQGNFIIEKISSIEMAGDFGFNLTQKEIKVLLCKTKGMQAKEIAEELGISNLSVYSIIRDVKQKTGMELIPLIMQLRKMYSEK
jgi:ATP/maltotriose-dependent transcriptional regulator MalT